MQLIITELFLSTVQFAFGSHSRQLPPGAVGLSGSSRLANMNSHGNFTNNTASDCFFFFSDSQIRADADGEMLREMKACCPGLLVAFCIINMFFAIFIIQRKCTRSFDDSLFLRTSWDYGKHRTCQPGNIQFVSRYSFTLFLFALGVNALFDGCPIFLSFRFSVFYFCHTLALNSLFNLCIITAERYIAVTFPLRYLSILPKKRMVKLIAVA